MEKSDNRKEKVIPGDELAVIEEYESGKGTHIIDGQIRASIFGKTKFDNKNKAKKLFEINKNKFKIGDMTTELKNILAEHVTTFSKLKLPKLKKVNSKDNKIKLPKLKKVKS